MKVARSEVMKRTASGVAYALSTHYNLHGIKTLHRDVAVLAAIPTDGADGAKPTTDLSQPVAFACIGAAAALQAVGVATNAVAVAAAVLAVLPE